MMIERLLNPLRGAVRELVEKRLWPVALALVVALVAVPLVIGSSSPDVPPPPATRAPAANAGPAAAITVVDPAVVGHSRPGAVRDPFYDPPAPKTQGAASAPATSAAGVARADRTPASSAPPPSRTVGAPSAPSASAPAARAPSAPAAPAPLAQDPVDTTSERAVLRTRVRWRDGDSDAAVRGLSRLQPLGGISSPALLYLGTTMNGTRAVFLLGPRAESSGEGRCAERSCRVIALKAGDERAVVLRGADGTVARRFTLSVDAIVRRVTATRAQAATIRARVHPWGRETLRAMIKDRPTAAAIGGFAYDRAAGAVVAASAT